MRKTVASGRQPTEAPKEWLQEFWNRSDHWMSPGVATHIICGLDPFNCATCKAEGIGIGHHIPGKHDSAFDVVAGSLVRMGTAFNGEEAVSVLRELEIPIPRSLKRPSWEGVPLSPENDDDFKIRLGDLPGKLKLAVRCYLANRRGGERFPKAEDLIEWMEGNGGNRYTETCLEAIASLTRPDGAPKGRRRRGE
ncbi:MAG: hypothetical protein FJZ01_01585 [Candidatus Sericytochromatia bacterium]|nr:hypothetical protein [Candidatus Tanganyikabacteria bacterium]